MASGSQFIVTRAAFPECYGPFCIIGDCHGCFAELSELLSRLGYTLDTDGRIWAETGSEAARTGLIFLGDYIDRGPDSAKVLALVMKAWSSGPDVFPQLRYMPAGLEENACKNVANAEFLGLTGKEGVFFDFSGRPVADLRRGIAGGNVAGMSRAVIFALKGNHEYRLERVLQGRGTSPELLLHGFGQTAESMREASENGLSFEEGEGNRVPFNYSAADLSVFLAGLPHWAEFDGGKLVAAHAGLSEEMRGASGRKAEEKARHFCLFGDTTGRTGPDGMPERLNWEDDYQGTAAVVFGHTPVSRVKISGRAFNIDTGCVFGGSLTAVRYPGMDFLQVPCRRVYSPRAGFSDR